MKAMIWIVFQTEFTQVVWMKSIQNLIHAWVIIFRRILNMQEKLFIQYRGVVSFFISLPTIFIFKYGPGSAVSANISQALGPGSNLCLDIKLYNFTDNCQKFQLFPWHSG